MPKKYSFTEALMVQQTGAKFSGRKGFFELGGGMFTDKQLIGARKRYARMKFGVKFK